MFYFESVSHIHTGLCTDGDILIDMWVRTQTPSTPSSNHCLNWLHHRSPKTVSYLTVFRWCPDGIKIIRDKSDYIRRYFYNLPHCLPQHKLNQNRLNQDEAVFLFLFCFVFFFFFFSPGTDAPYVYVRASTLCIFPTEQYASTVLLDLVHPKLSEGANSVVGQMHGDKECPFSGVTNYGRVWGTGAGKRGVERDAHSTKV